MEAEGKYFNTNKNKLLKKYIRILRIQDASQSFLVGYIKRRNVSNNSILPIEITLQNVK